MKTLLQIGAGNIGRACIGRLFHEAGYNICFMDVNRSLLDLLDEHHSYPVKLVGKNCDQTITIDRVCSFSEHNKEELYKQLSIITTAVGVPILPKIAPAIVEIITYRFKNNIETPVNIIACENAIKASSTLKSHVIPLFTPEIISWMEGKIAFPDAATDSIVPITTNTNPLLVTSENFAEIIIDKSTFIGTLPEVDGLFLKDNLDAYIERKLFTLNTGHAVTAYLGFQKGFQTIKQAIADPEIKNTAAGAMKESGNVLIHRYGFNLEEHQKYINKILERFENPYLDDELIRVGRDPLRKLSKNDRLIKPALGALEYKLSYDNLLKGIIAALKFYNPTDESSIQMTELLKDKQQGLAKITGLSHNEGTELLNNILEQL
ncbi:MAG: mannitol-1-phosphate 5-dehydrogenase [Brevinemataceae bacterium]